MLVWVYTCQNATLLEISCHCSNFVIYYRKLIQAAINVQRLIVPAELPENVSSEFKVCKVQPFKYPFRI